MIGVAPQVLYLSIPLLDAFVDMRTASSNG